MARDIPKLPQNWQPPKPPQPKEYVIELITPMFGGGVKTREVDPSFAIRPTAIRGHLQFWWRATAGSTFGTKQKLREKQDQVWGNTNLRSKVVISSEVLEVGATEKCAHFEIDQKGGGQFRSTPVWARPFTGNALSYVLFPFQGQLSRDRRNIEVEPANCIFQIKFRLILDCPDDIWEQVKTAIIAWVNFGGIGSRTRRGCGALFCKELAPATVNDVKELWKHLKKSPDFNPEWPTLNTLYLEKEKNSPIDAWSNCVNIYRTFRQGVGFGRNPGSQPNRPGRSFFPEPETIRRATGQRLPIHARLPEIPDDGFPRAEFGLPIVFHFQKGGMLPNDDPEDVELYPSNDQNGTPIERMASPLIFRPIKLGNLKTVPMILLLKTQQLQGVELRKSKRKIVLNFKPKITDPKYSKLSPIKYSQRGSALESFLEFTLKNGFTKV